jgi:hypothetical protein
MARVRCLATSRRALARAGTGARRRRLALRPAATGLPPTTRRPGRCHADAPMPSRPPIPLAMTTQENALIELSALLESRPRPAGRARDHNASVVGPRPRLPRTPHRRAGEPARMPRDRRALATVERGRDRPVYNPLASVQGVDSAPNHLGLGHLQLPCPPLQQRGHGRAVHDPISFSTRLRLSRRGSRQASARSRGRDVWDQGRGPRTGSRDKGEGAMTEDGEQG